MSASWHQCGVCLISNIVRPEIKVAHVTQKVTQAQTLGIKVVDIELSTWSDRRTYASPLEDTCGSRRESFVVNRINEIGLVHVDFILYLSLK